MDWLCCFKGDSPYTGIDEEARVGVLDRALLVSPTLLANVRCFGCESRRDLRSAGAMFAQQRQLIPRRVVAETDVPVNISSPRKRTRAIPDPFGSRIGALRPRTIR